MAPSNANPRLPNPWWIVLDMLSCLLPLPQHERYLVSCCVIPLCVDNPIQDRTHESIGLPVHRAVQSHAWCSCLDQCDSDSCRKVGGSYVGLWETRESSVSGQQYSILTPTKQPALPGWGSRLQSLRTWEPLFQGERSSCFKWEGWWKEPWGGQSRHKVNEGKSVTTGQCGGCAENVWMEPWVCPEEELEMVWEVEAFDTVALWLSLLLAHSSAPPLTHSSLYIHRPDRTWVGDQFNKPVSSRNHQAKKWPEKEIPV